MPFSNKKSPTSPSMERQSPGETLIATVKRHPFGIISLYVEVLFGLIAAGALIYFVLPNFINQSGNSDAYRLVAIVMAVVTGVLLIILVLATIIYRACKLIITDKDITQITQQGLFYRKISQLSISNIEDATADKRGLFQTLLDYGVLNIETAGETENFTFTYCPDPDKYAKTILQLREAFLSNRERDKLEAGVQYMRIEQAAAGYVPVPIATSPPAGSAPQAYAPPAENTNQVYAPPPPAPLPVVPDLAMPSYVELPRPTPQSQYHPPSQEVATLSPEPDVSAYPQPPAMPSSTSQQYTPPVPPPTSNDFSS